MKKMICIVLCILVIMCMGIFPAYAGSENVLNISAEDESYQISDKLYGSFIEDISYACDGGLVSNLVNNDSFEYEFNKTTAWKADGIELTAETENSMNKNNPTYACISSNGKGTLTNTGFTELYRYKTYERDEEKAQTHDMGFKEGTEYAFSCYIMNKSFDGRVSVYLNSKHNRKNITVLDISNTKGIWTEIKAILKSEFTEDGGLTLEFDGNGEIYLDFVTLVPTDSHGFGTNEWKYTSLRSDLYEVLEHWSPAFVRFPGGCLAEGDRLENLYDWKETIGPLEERVQFYNLWRDDVGRDYINTMAMGYHEFFQLCSDLNAEALPILNVGLTCQGRAGYDDHVIALEKAEMTEQEWETYLTEARHIPVENTQERTDFTNYINGFNINSREDFEAYLDSIALRPGTAEWDAYVQDILDLIEYANGDSETTYWGALRAANGRTEPFNLKYIGLGNENWGEIYERNFRELYKEVKKACPEITVISSSGAWLEGDAYNENWQWINSDFRDTIVDEHYYTGDGYLFDHNDRYDNFDREGAHVFIGEYAATAKGVGTLETKSNILEAVEEASYLTGVERNGDVVEMTSYAPTFAKVNAQCWNINLIWFDSQEVVLTPSYYVQMLYSNNYGSTYLKSVFENGDTIQNGIYESVTVDKEEEIIYVKLVNTTGKRQSVSINLSGFDNISRVSSQSISGKYKSACNEIGRLTTYPVEKEYNAENSVSVNMEKYDVTVLRIAYGDNDGSALFTLPNNISTMANPSVYAPDIIRIGVPCVVAGVAVIAGVITGVIVFIKKRKDKNSED